jgi:hypothetical protein
LKPLLTYVARKGGPRLSMHGGVRDRLVAMAVEEFPLDAAIDRKEEVLRARLRLRIRREHGSIVASILIGVLVNLIARLVVEWWLDRRAHRVLMEGWVHALASADIPPPAPAP